MAVNYLLLLVQPAERIINKRRTHILVDDKKTCKCVAVCTVEPYIRIIPYRTVAVDSQRSNTWPLVPVSLRDH